MKLKLKEILDMKKSLTVLSRKNLPIRLSYRLGKLVRKVNQELKDLELLRIKLVKRLGHMDQETKRIVVSEENEQQFHDEYNSLLSEEVEINFDPISLKELECIQMNALDMGNLINIIKEED